MSKYAQKQQRQHESFANQLSSKMKDGSLSPQRTKKLALVYTGDLKPCTWWQGDGVDHVRIGNDAETNLGVVLTPHYRLDFVHDVFGKLDSVSRLWTQLDYCVGGRAVMVQGSNAQFILADALYQRVKQFPKLASAVYDCDLPFDYYDWNDRNIPFRRNIWWLEAVYAIRDALQSGREYPNFSALLERGQVSDIETRDKVLQDFINRFVPNHRGAVLARSKVKATTQDNNGTDLIKSLRLEKPQAIEASKSFSIAMSFNPIGSDTEQEDKAKTKALYSELATKLDGSMRNALAAGLLTPTIDSIESELNNHREVMADFESRRNERHEEFLAVVMKLTDIVKEGGFYSSVFDNYFSSVGPDIADVKAIKLKKGFGKTVQTLTIHRKPVEQEEGVVRINLRFYINGRFQLYVLRPSVPGEENKLEEIGELEDNPHSDVATASTLPQGENTKAVTEEDPTTSGENSGDELGKEEIELSTEVTESETTKIGYEQVWTEETYNDICSIFSADKETISVEDIQKVVEVLNKDETLREFSGKEITELVFSTPFNTEKTYIFYHHQDHGWLFDRTEEEGEKESTEG